MYNNYPYGGGPNYMTPQTPFTQYNSQPNSLKGRPVSSIEEVRAAQIDFDGSLFVFPDVANKKIYTKQINLDGTASMKIYAQVEEASPASAYITREELDLAINQLKNTFINGKGKTNESKPTTSSNNAALSF